MMPAILQTVTGPVGVDDVTVALPHEHLFVDFRCLLGERDPGDDQGDADDIRAAVATETERVRAMGVDLLADCTCRGIGRNIRLIREASLATGLRVACATGLYKGFVPPGLAGAPAQELAALFSQELTVGIGGTDVRAGFIKLASTETGPTPLETIIHRAGAMAAARTGAAIVLHSPFADTTRAVLGTFEAEGFDPARLVWAHAHDSTLEDNLELAERGVTISFDAISSSDDREILSRIERLAEAGHADRVLVSTDSSLVVHPPERAYPRDIAHLLGGFLPRLEARLGAEFRRHLVRDNVFRALGSSTVEG
jgi:phosphotriesterase-related protein